MKYDGNTNFFVHSLMRAPAWQPRVEFEELEAWWRRTEAGICALVGLGGAGKTAIVERFLRVLPNGLPIDQSVPKLEYLVPPYSTFVYSFYDSPNTNDFFDNLQVWLQRDVNTDYKLPVSRIKYLLTKCRGLMVLDGLERVQEDGSREPLGRISCPALREVLDHIAAGYVDGLRTIVTSRFRLTDLRDARPPFFHEIPITDLDESAALRLQRDRGVVGTNESLRAFLGKCGSHALTLDLAASYIGEFGGGDPTTPLDLGSDEELAEAIGGERNAKRRVILKQGYRFRRLTSCYREAIKASDPVALQVLELICIFRLGITEQAFRSIFCTPNAGGSPIPAVSVLSAEELHLKISWLVDLNLVESVQAGSAAVHQELASPRVLLRSHPAIKDGFLAGIPDDTLARNHNEAKVGLASLLSNIPGRAASATHDLDLCEEIIHHALQSGHVQEAWDVYQSRLGGCHNLLQKLNDYRRARRVTHSIAEQADLESSPFNAYNRVVLQNDLGYSSLEVGDTFAGQESLYRGWRLSLVNKSNLKTLFNNYGRSLVLTGELRKLLEVVLTTLPELRDPPTVLWAIESLLEYREWRGELLAQVTMDDIEIDLKGADPDRLRPHFPIYPATDFRCRTSSVHEAAADVARLRMEDPRLRKELVNALHRYSAISLDRGESAVPLEDLQETLDWSIERSCKEAFCEASLLIGRTLLLEMGSKSPSREEVDPIDTSFSSNFTNVERHLNDGLRVAADCGYSLHHINLRLERAKLYLMAGWAGAAKEDVISAIWTGVPDSEALGTPRLLAATDEECQFAWAVPLGKLRKAECQLLQVAQEHQSCEVALALRNSDSAELVNDSTLLLRSAIEDWASLHDPSTNGDSQNWMLEGKLHHPKARLAHNVLTTLKSGVLTTYPLSCQLTAEQGGRRADKGLGGAEVEMLKAQKRFLVALSFPGDYRFRVEVIAGILAHSIGKTRVFYDNYYKAELARPNLDSHLQRIYRDDSELVVVFICKEYQTKDWCSLEWRAIRDVLKNRRGESIMFVKMGEGDPNVEGFFSIDGYISGEQHDDEQIAELILERLASDSASS